MDHIGDLVQWHNYIHHTSFDRFARHTEDHTGGFILCHNEIVFPLEQA